MDALPAAVRQKALETLVPHVLGALVTSATATTPLIAAEDSGMELKITPENTEFMENITLSAKEIGMRKTDKSAPCFVMFLPICFARHFTMGQLSVSLPDSATQGYDYCSYALRNHFARLGFTEKDHSSKLPDVVVSSIMAGSRLWYEQSTADTSPSELEVFSKKLLVFFVDLLYAIEEHSSSPGCCGGKLISSFLQKDFKQLIESVHKWVEYNHKQIRSIAAKPDTAYLRTIVSILDALSCIVVRRALADLGVKHPFVIVTSRSAAKKDLRNILRQKFTPNIANLMTDMLMRLYDTSRRNRLQRYIPQHYQEPDFPAVIGVEVQALQVTEQDAARRLKADYLYESTICCNCACYWQENLKKLDDFVHAAMLVTRLRFAGMLWEVAAAHSLNTSPFVMELVAWFKHQGLNLRAALGPLANSRHDHHTVVRAEEYASSSLVAFTSEHSSGRSFDRPRGLRATALFDNCFKLDASTGSTNQPISVMMHPVDALYNLIYLTYIACFVLEDAAQECDLKTSVRIQLDQFLHIYERVLILLKETVIKDPDTSAAESAPAASAPAESAPAESAPAASAPAASVPAASGATASSGNAVAAGQMGAKDKSAATSVDAQVCGILSSSHGVLLSNLHTDHLNQMLPQSANPASEDTIADESKASDRPPSLTTSAQTKAKDARLLLELASVVRNVNSFLSSAMRDRSVDLESWRRLFYFLVDAKLLTLNNHTLRRSDIKDARAHELDLVPPARFMAGLLDPEASSRQKLWLKFIIRNCDQKLCLANTYEDDGSSSDGDASYDDDEEFKLSYRTVTFRRLSSRRERSNRTKLVEMQPTTILRGADNSFSETARV